MRECSNGYTPEVSLNPLIIEKKYAFLGDNGLFLSRCQGCISSSNYLDAVTVHLDNPHLPFDNWLIADASDGKVALQADTGKYIARTEDNVSVMVYATSPMELAAQWKIIPMGNGKIAFQDNNNHYLCRCNNCVAATTPDVADTHCTNPNDPWAQWTPILMK